MTESLMMHNKLISAFEQSTQNIVLRHWRGGNREKLKILRLALGMTQKEFATVFGLPYASVRNWEQKGGREPSGTAAMFIDLIIESPEVVGKLVEKVNTRRSETADLSEID